MPAQGWAHGQAHGTSRLWGYMCVWICGSGPVKGKLKRQPVLAGQLGAVGSPRSVEQVASAQGDGGWGEY